MLRLYTLRLDGGCWYVGVTRNPERRMRAHQNGTGAAWTRAHAPIEPNFASIRELDCEEPRAKLLEDAETKALMLLHGVDCVRGGSTRKWSLMRPHAQLCWSSCGMQSAPACDVVARAMTRATARRRARKSGVA